MGAEVILPDGQRETSQISFKYVVAIGPADPVAFQVVMNDLIRAHESDITTMTAACERREVECFDEPGGASSNASGQPSRCALLVGWPYYRVEADPTWDGSPDTPIETYLYAPGEIEDTMPTPVATTVVETLVNHLGAEIARRRVQMQRLRADLERFQAGDLEPLGHWRVYRWARDEAMASRAAGTALGHAALFDNPVVTLATRPVSRTTLHLPGEQS